MVSCCRWIVLLLGVLAVEVMLMVTVAKVQEGSETQNVGGRGKG